MTMSSQPSREQIEALVARALEATLRQEAYPERLLPFTQAQLNFMRDFVAEVISSALGASAAEP